MYVAIAHVVPWLMRTLIVPKDKKSAAQSMIGARGISRLGCQDDNDDDVMIITDQPTTSKESEQQDKRKKMKLHASNFMTTLSEQ